MSLEAEANPIQRMTLSIKWNQYEATKMEMRSENFHSADDFDVNMYSLLETALVENRPKFVDLILEQEINLRNFLSSERLYRLYNSDNVSHCNTRTLKIFVLAKFLFFFTIQVSEQKKEDGAFFCVLGKKR
jgi:hypothetical protein